MSTEGLDDRTARARIRDAALARFGEAGVARATVRAIAADAGVSPGLVLHHFGSKEGLRAACDEYVTATIQRAKTEAMATGESDPFVLLAKFERAAPMLRYLSRSLADGSPAATRLFDEMVRDAMDYIEVGVRNGLMPPSDEPYDRAVVLVAWQLGALVLSEHIARAFGAEPFSTDLLARWTRAGTELLTRGAFADDRYALAARLLDEADEVQGRSAVAAGDATFEEEESR